MPVGHRNTKRAVVVGAGPVGVCSAIYLQKEGFEVTLLDPRGPGEGCTGGNTGSLGYGYCVPQAMPGIIKKVPRMLRDPMHPFKIRYAHLLPALPWFSRFARASDPQRVTEVADSLSKILKVAESSYTPLIRGSDAGKFVKKKGRVWIYESEESLARARTAHKICRDRGVKIEELAPADIGEFVPQLNHRKLWGAFMPSNGHVTNPLKFVQSLAKHFVAEGGHLIKQEATDIEQATADRLNVVLGNGETRTGDIVVIAAGAWSKKLAKKQGDKIPLEAEWGYNMILPHADIELKQPVVLADRFVALTSMDDGLRLGGVAEYASIDAKPDYHRARRLFNHAMSLFEEISFKNATEWTGPRPAVPDSLPIIGRSSWNPKILYAFGHGHAGLTLGAISGRLISELAAQKVPTIDVTPFSSQRFWSDDFNRYLKFGVEHLPL